MTNSLLILGAALSSLLVLSSGVRVLFKEVASTTSFLFFLATLGASSWLATLALALGSGDAEAATLWGRASLASSLLIPVSVLHFTTTLCTSRKLDKWLVSVSWMATLALIVSVVGSTVWVQGVYAYQWGFYTRLGPAGAVLVLWMITLLTLALARLVSQYRVQTEQSVRRRLRILITSFAFGDLALIDFLPAFGVPVVPLGLIGIGGFALIASRGLRAMSLTTLNPSYAANQILATMQGSVLVTDLDGLIRVANEAAEALLHCPESKLVGRSLSEFVESPYNVGRASDTLMQGRTIRDRPMLWRTADHRLVEVGVSASLLRDSTGFPSGIVYVASDISEKERAKQIEYQAFHDALTGLPNRIFFRRRLDEAIDASDDDHVPAVVFLDLDGFKVVNDSLGHSVGDELLQAVARRLKQVVRTDDIVCRLGGDEFVVLMRIRASDHATTIGQKILESVREHLTIDGERVQVTGSIGIALYPSHGNDSESLLKNADSAMYAAKDAGKNQVVLCGPEIAARATNRFRIESELRQAMSREELELHYQPIVDLMTNRMVGAEALLRWRRGDRLVQPAEFLTVAEETGLIREIGEWALFMACRDANGWMSTASEPLRISVNLSAEQLRDREITEAVASALSLNEIPAGCLVLEVTESAAMRNVEQSIKILGELKDLGTQLAIDDFGTGYSSLSYLQRFPIDLLKIDRTFVLEMGRNRSSTAIVAATVAMARALDLDVVAEGVETRYQIAALRMEKCRYAQGYAFGRPVPAEQFPSVLQDWNTRPALSMTPEADPEAPLYLPVSDAPN